MNVKRVNKQSLMRTAEQVFSKGLVAALAEKGLDVLEGERAGVILCDTDGKSYIDCYTSAGIYNLGRNNEELRSELEASVRKVDQGNFIMLSEEKALLGQKLARFVPGNLESVLYTVVRGEPVDAACKLARGHTGRPELVTVDGGWYGQTGFAVTLSERTGKGMFGALIPAVATVPFGDIGAMKRAVSRKTAAVIMEPVQAENGCRRAGAEYYRELRRICDRKGAFLIFDETQTGFGRTGKKFAYEHYDIVPDILILGEAMSGGVFPMTALMFTIKTRKFFDAHPLIHMCTFGGHDIGCRVAMKALDLYEETKPWESAVLMGEKLHAALSGIAAGTHGKVSVSGIGLLQALLFRDDATAARFCREARKIGLLAVQGEVAANSVVFRPSLTIDIDGIAEIELRVRRAMAKVL
ncbi:MAG: aspartate aminotransferase family protein [Spirochaetes bacterium]|nr:aspartate aminotransferase family protein [Spirochaetota bacterium]